jgi:hypothetical protein
MSIERKSIGRAGIRSAGYDRAARILEVEFDNGSVVQHSGVGEELARRFLASGAPASFYRDNVEDEFTRKRVK